jgi:F0F1-type ATP synthase assembly protein I
MLGLAMTLPMVLLSGPLAGYLISQWLIQKWHATPQLTLILVLVGLCGSAVQTVRILKLLYKGSEKKAL